MARAASESDTFRYSPVEEIERLTSGRLRVA